MEKITEAFKTLQSAGLLVEEFPGDGYKKPVLQMLQEIESNDKDLKKLVDYIVNDKWDGIVKAFRDTTRDFREIKSDTDYHGNVLYGAWFEGRFAHNSREARSNGRYIFSVVSAKAGIPVKFSKDGGASKRITGWSEYWCIDFNVLTKDDGSYDLRSIAEVVGNDDKYWEILDELYAHRKDRTVSHEPSEEEKEIQKTKDLNDYKRNYVDPILDTPLTAKDLERLNTSTVNRQLATLDKMNPEKVRSRKKAILAMALRRFGGFSSTGQYFYTGFFHSDENRISVGSFTWNIFGRHIPKTWGKTDRDYKEFWGKIFMYCKEQLEKELSNIYGE